MKYKVILADDEEEALFGIQRNLDWEGYGFEVVGTFGNGRDVMEFLETQEADIVITDIRMPFMDGIELAKNIYDSYPQTKVIIISGYGDFQYAKEAMSYRVMDYILKPVNAREMGEALQKVYETLEQEIRERQNRRIFRLWALQKFIEAFAIEETWEKGFSLQGESYYMIPLKAVAKEDIEGEH